jgi:hypothetical protein
MRTPNEIDENKGLFFLIDKYLKTNNNYLPLQAYLDFIDSDSLGGFESIASIKASEKQRRKAETASSLCMTRNVSTNQVILAQKVYKCIITIDYSCHLSSMELIRTSLQRIMDKIEAEYEQFSLNCPQSEPVVDLTVLLWNPLFKHEPSNVESVPFALLIYSKRLVRSTLDSIVEKVILKLKKSKSLITDSSSRTTEFESGGGGVGSNKHLNQNANYKLKVFNSFELLVSLVIKIFHYLSINSVTSPPNFSVQHHIHITDGIFYTTDLIKTLDRIGKSSISFSFVCTGSSDQSDSNISSSFGYLSDHFLMKFVASITNGFYGVIDENLEYKLIYSQPIFYFHDLSLKPAQDAAQQVFFCTNFI